ALIRTPEKLPANNPRPPHASIRHLPQPSVTSRGANRPPARRECQPANAARRGALFTETRTIYTLNEVAERYQFTPRQLRDLVRRKDVPVLTTGRAIRFDDIAIQALEGALRRCPSTLSPEKTPAPYRLLARSSC